MPEIEHGLLSHQNDTLPKNPWDVGRGVKLPLFWGTRGPSRLGVWCETIGGVRSQDGFLRLESIKTPNTRIWGVFLFNRMILRFQPLIYPVYLIYFNGVWVTFGPNHHFVVSISNIRGVNHILSHIFPYAPWSPCISHMLYVKNI